MGLYGYFIRFAKPQIQSHVWLKYFRPQNQLSGAGPGAVCHCQGQNLQMALFFLSQVWSVLTWRTLFFFSTLACLLREERIYRSLRTPCPKILSAIAQQVPML